MVITLRPHLQLKMSALKTTSVLNLTSKTLPTKQVGDPRPTHRSEEMASDSNSCFKTLNCSNQTSHHSSSKEKSICKKEGRKNLTYSCHRNFEPRKSFFKVANKTIHRGTKRRSFSQQLVRVTIKSSHWKRWHSSKTLLCCRRVLISFRQISRWRAFKMHWWRGVSQ